MRSTNFFLTELLLSLSFFVLFSGTSVFAQESMSQASPSSPGELMSGSEAPLNENVTKYCNEKYETEGLFLCEWSSVGESVNAAEECKSQYYNDCYRTRNEFEREEEAKKIQQPQQAYVPRGVDTLNILNTSSLAGMLAKILTTFIQVIGSIALLMFVYGGILWMTSQGNSEKIGHAVKVMVWSALGVVVILSSYAIVDFLFGTFG